MIFAPTLNAILNGASAVFLACGYVMIRKGRMAAHRAFMLSAFCCSIVFLISYVLYHLKAGVFHFAGQGWIRPAYFILLTTHTILAIVIVPLVLITLSRALRRRFDRHRLIARWTLPIWFYVSVTGVIIYWMLYHLYATPSA